MSGLDCEYKGLSAKSPIRLIDIILLLLKSKSDINNL